MKTSNIILIATGLLILATLVLANIGLKAEFEKGGYKHRFYKLETVPLAAVRNISISAPGYLRICIEASASNVLKYPADWEEYIEVSVQGDSLKLSVKEGVSYGMDTLYILRKDLASITMTDRGRLKISLLQQSYLKVIAEKNSDIAFEHAAIDTLEITGRDHSAVFTKENNKIGFLNLLLEDKAVFKAGDLEFSDLETQIGPQSKVEFTGSSLVNFLERSKL